MKPKKPTDPHPPRCMTCLEIVQAREVKVGEGGTRWEFVNTDGTPHRCEGKP